MSSIPCSSVNTMDTSMIHIGNDTPPPRSDDSPKSEFNFIRRKRIRRHAPERPTNLNEIREAFKKGTYVMKGWLANDDDSSNKPSSASERWRKDGTFLVPQAPVRRSAALPPYPRAGPSSSLRQSGRDCGGPSSRIRRMSASDRDKDLRESRRQGPIGASGPH
uniref:Uncharacterized protein n=1 Tax=Panagrellus redivivus TaxID=6233 RepID=A0A7E4VWS0_PANRE